VKGRAGVKEEVRTAVKIQYSIQMNVSAEKVSQYTSDVNNLPNYLPISDVEVLEKSKEVVTLRHKFTALGEIMGLVSERRTLEKNREIQYKVVGGMNLEVTWLFEPREKGTRVTNILEYEVPGWISAKIMDEFKTKKEMARVCSEGLERLKKILEAQE